MFHPSRAQNATIISKLNNFAEVLAVRVHVDVYMATPALRSLTHETLCDTTATATATTTTTTYLPTTTPIKSHHFKPSILAFFAFGKKIIDGKNSCLLIEDCSWGGKIFQITCTYSRTGTNTDMGDGIDWEWEWDSFYNTGNFILAS